MKEVSSLDRLAYLNALGKDKPFEILLKIIEVECYEMNFEDMESLKNDSKTISNLIKEKYHIDIDAYILERWFQSYFKVVDGKAQLKITENLSDEINHIKEEEKKFLDKVSDIRKEFIEYAQTQFGVTLENELAKKIFDRYVYSVASDRDLSLFQNNKYFIFQEFIKKLYLEDREKLKIIENFGVANQIKDIVLNGDEEEGNENFLEGCIIFLDTPIVLERLGYDGKNLSDTYKNFLDDLQKAGAKLKVYEHTLDEIWSILFNFKRCIAQNNFNGKGVITFLKARKEFLESNPSKELPLDRDKVKKNIEVTGFEIYSMDDSDCLETRECYEEWEIDENEFKKILTNIDPNYELHEARLNKDIQSISATSRLRKRDNIGDIKNYKDGRYYFLVDNFALIRSIKEYYEKKGVIKSKNELLLENTVLFLLWQNLTKNNELNRSLFRSKCFAISTIDEEFKEKLYRETRKIEVYDTDVHISEEIIANPDMEREVYRKIIKDHEDQKTIDELYLSKTIYNVIDENNEKIVKEVEEKYENKLNLLEENKEKELNDKTKEYEEKLENIRKQNEKKKLQDNIDSVKKLVLSKKKSVCYAFIKFLYNLVDKDYDEILWTKNCEILGYEIEYKEEYLKNTPIRGDNI